jgi:hypothetical protein
VEEDDDGEDFQPPQQHREHEDELGAGGHPGVVAGGADLAQARADVAEGAGGFISAGWINSHAGQGPAGCRRKKSVFSGNFWVVGASYLWDDWRTVWMGLAKGAENA